MERLGRTIRAAEKKGPARYCNGVTVSAASGGRIDVEVPAGRRPAIIPGSFRAALALGQNVRLSVVGDTYTIDGVLSALPTPTVAAPPAAISWTSYGADPITVDSTTSISALISDLNSIFDHLQTVQSDFATDINDLKTKLNGNLTTTVGIHDAQVSGGFIQ